MKKHPSTGDRSAAHSILRGKQQTSELPPYLETLRSLMNSASKYLCKAHHKLSTCSQPLSFSSHYHTYRSVTEENTHHTAFTVGDKKVGEIQTSFH